MHRQLVRFADGDPDGLGDDVRIRSQPVPAHLVRDDQPLLAVDRYRERRPAPGLQSRVCVTGGRLDVLRVVVEPAQDDQILDAAGDEQLAVVDQTEVTGAQERPLAGAQVRVEGLRRLLGTLPVPARHARAADPHLALGPVRPRRAGLRIDDRQPLLVARYREMVSSQRNGWATNSAGGIRTTGYPVYSGWSRPPMSPMSW